MAFGDRLFKEVMKPGQICSGLLIYGTVLDLVGAVAVPLRELVKKGPVVGSGPCLQDPEAHVGPSGSGVDSERRGLGVGDASGTFDQVPRRPPETTDYAPAGAAARGEAVGRHAVIVAATSSGVLVRPRKQELKSLNSVWSSGSHWTHPAALGATQDF